MPFIHDDFLLQSPAARRLFHEYAKSEPILDYHNHLPPRDIAQNRQFSDLAQLWLEGDHYKWRAMRADGVAERFCTGDAAPYEKFLAWVKVVPHTLRNPLFHWTHLELKRLFGIDELLNEESAPAIWERANSLLQTPEFSAQGILKKFEVRALCTTDDPALPLEWHQKIAADGNCTAWVYPTFRPDKALAIDQNAVFEEWTNQLGAAANLEIASFADFLSALDARHADFHAAGCRLSDHGLAQAPADFATADEAEKLFGKARKNEAISPSETARFAGFMMLFFGGLDAKRGWIKQLHLGARRSNSSRGLAQLGPDTGFDSVADLPQIAALGAYLDRLESEDSLPKMVLYNLNPADNYAFATMAGNFQGNENGVAGRIQFGSGWWFLDQKEAMEWQINALSNNGLLSRFIGMLTDSRSFASFPRHEYFRRVLCNLVGRDIENGELPADFDLVGEMIKRICYANARDFLGLTTAD